MPAARTSSSTSPGPGLPVASSTTDRTSGPPKAGATTTRLMPAPTPPPGPVFRSLGRGAGSVALRLLAAGPAHPDRLGVHELAHAQLGELTAVAALLHAAEGEVRIAGGHAVDERHAGLDVPDEPGALVLVLAPQVGAQPVGVAVGDLDRLVQAVDGPQRGHRPEDLLAVHLHLRRDPGEQGRLVEPPGPVDPVPTDHDGRPLGPGVLDVLLDVLDAGLGGQRADLGVGDHRVADGQRADLLGEQPGELLG